MDSLSISEQIKGDWFLKRILNQFSYIWLIFTSFKNSLPRVKHFELRTHLIHDELHTLACCSSKMLLQGSAHVTGTLQMIWNPWHYLACSSYMERVSHSCSFWCSCTRYTHKKKGQNIWMKITPRLRKAKNYRLSCKTGGCTVSSTSVSAGLVSNKDKAFVSLQMTRCK